MANDRIFIRCNRCGDKVCLTKYYPSVSLGNPADVNTQKVGEFLIEHLRHHAANERYHVGLQNNPGFSFETEGTLNWGTAKADWDDVDGVSNDSSK